MKKDDLIIFGRSPFINEINVHALLAKDVVTAGVNNFAQYYPIDYCFMYDDFWAPSDPLNTTTLVPYTTNIPDGMINVLKIAPITAHKEYPITDYKEQSGHPCFTMCYFSTSLAINWALFRDFGRIFLIGVDHNEEQETMPHFDGIDQTISVLSPAVHKAFKRYVYRCAEHIPIYQCNPAQAGLWDLPYYDIAEI